MKLLALLLGLLCVTIIHGQPKPGYNLDLKQIPLRWDEALPLGNGWLGALIWQKENKLRISLDRVDLWDDRPMPQIDRLTFKWVQQQVAKGEYDTVQKIGDWPYEQNAAPCKIPGAAIEFKMPDASVVSASLDISNGISSVIFSNGIRFGSYIHASKQEGYFGWTEFDPSLIDSFLPSLIPPRYQAEQAGSPKDGGSLSRLGYEQGKITKGKNSLRYHQPTWGTHYYEVLIEWVNIYNKKLVGAWTISVDKPASLHKIDTAHSEYTDMRSHLAWWKDFWDRSSISIPDTLLERQYYLDMYKFGCVARSNAPPISLQAIWTADDGRLLPWKGDLHHDLNTQLSYWPGYTANHTDLTAGFTNWLWKVRAENKRWTQQYFGVEGLNVPGVSTISGKPMGGWIQYAMSPTTVCWLSQNFYWQWRYTNDTAFLRERAYPWVRDAATYIVNLVRKRDGNYYLPLSSSPEYNDNKISAWFSDWTNYDLSLVSYLLQTESIMARALNRPRDAQRKRLEELRMALPSAAVDETGLLMAPGVRMDHSHRHMSPYISLFPLKNLHVVAKAIKNDTTVIANSFRHLERFGT
ncbi:MAG: glycoside hydrolase N-terminal domain-containing protein, partial [Chitinophagaceae bacterium]|nr:glycoside hydrolase N-terminal domain-containing protein [Chitinophagaceae bacterium]